MSTPILQNEIEARFEGITASDLEDFGFNVSDYCLKAKSFKDAANSVYYEFHYFPRYRCQALPKGFAPTAVFVSLPLINRDGRVVA